MVWWLFEISPPAVVGGSPYRLERRGSKVQETKDGLGYSGSPVLARGGNERQALHGPAAAWP
jgi:hypothetical protein